MNIKQKMIAAMRYSYERNELPMKDALDIALDVLADPENWTSGMEVVANCAALEPPQVVFSEIVKFIKEQQA